MEPSEVQRALQAATATASSLGLTAEDSELIHNSNRIVVRLLPCDTLVRIAPAANSARDSEHELQVAGLLHAAGAPVAGPDPRVEPRVYGQDGFETTFWTFHQPVDPAGFSPEEYAKTMALLHTGLRAVDRDVDVPHFTDRVAQAQAIVANPAVSPHLAGPDRERLSTALERLTARIRDAAPNDQLLHGEPHVGNVLRTTNGLLLVDFQTVCRGPIEFDIAHSLLPNEVGQMFAADSLSHHYPGANAEVVALCRTLIWAMITSWRWDESDQLPNRDHWRQEGLRQLRIAHQI